MPNIVRIQTEPMKFSNDVIKSRFRAGIKESDTVVRFERSRGNNAGVTELTSIKYVNQVGIKKDELRKRRTRLRRKVRRGKRSLVAP